MYIRFYTVQPLQLEVRGTFELPVWPYNMKHRDHLYKYFKEYSIFWYEDDVSEWGGQKTKPIIYMADTAPEEFPCFLHSCHVNDDTFKIQRYPESMVKNDKTVKKQISYNNDTFAWKDFNIFGTIKEIKPNGSHVFIKNTDYLVPCENQCKEQPKRKFSV